MEIIEIIEKKNPITTKRPWKISIVKPISKNGIRMVTKLNKKILLMFTGIAIDS